MTSGFWDYYNVLPLMGLPVYYVFYFTMQLDADPVLMILGAWGSSCWKTSGRKDTH